MITLVTKANTNSKGQLEHESVKDIRLHLLGKY